MAAKVTKWEGKALVELHTLPTNILIKRYGHDRKYLAVARYRTKKRFNQYIQELRMEPSPNTDPTNLDKISELLERSGIAPEDIQRVEKVRVGTYQMLTKNDEGEAEIHDLEVRNIVYTPKTEYDESLFISQAPPTVIRPTKSRPKTNREETAIILPDIQAGYRKFEDGTLDPFHDVQAIDVCLQIIKDLQPTQVILNGDNLDLPQFGRFNQENTYAHTLNPTLEYVHNLLAQIRANSPDSRIVYLAGNHELRLQKYLMQYADKMFGVRQAGTGDNILTVPFLLNLADIEVQYESGYPANRYYINDRLKAIHGHTVRAAGQTAGAIVRKEDDSTLFGHVHRHEYAARTLQTRRGAQYLIAQSFGCLARIDGVVPSYGNGIDEDGVPVASMENWQHGAGCISYTSGDKPFDAQQIHIRTFDGYETNFNGKTYRPNV